MDRKLVDTVFKRQNMEYSCTECGRYDDGTKELNDGEFKMPKVLKDMLYILYKAAPGTLRDLAVVRFLLLGKLKSEKLFKQKY
jgi:hypothetical protein